MPHHRCIATRIAASALVLASTAARTADRPVPPPPAPLDLSHACQAGSLQAVASALDAGVTIQPIGNGPRFDGGVKYTAARGDIPAFC